MVTLTPDLDLNDYLRVLKRRKFHFLIAFSSVVIVALLLAFLLPPRYRSEATLLIERQAIPTDLVDTTVTGYVQERIEQITQKILTFDNIRDLAVKHNLYPDILAANQGEAIRLIREDFDVNMLDVEATDPDKAGSRQATIAFTVEFYASTPKAAQAVVADLAERYLQENERARIEETTRVASFLEGEADKLSVEIKQAESEIADFKKAEMNNLPEVAQLNRTLYEKTEGQIDSTRDRIRDLESRIDSTNAELAVTPMYNDVRTEGGGVILSSQDRMNSLVAQYIRATSRYSAKHPDVINLSREIRNLAEQTGSAGRADELMDALIRQQELLRQAQQKYGPDHPDVTQLQRSVTALETGFQKALTSTGSTGKAAEPDNPRFVSLRSQLVAAETALRAEQEKLGRYDAKLADYEQRLTVSPIVESKYKDLTRELQSKVSKYNDLKNKQMQARLAQELETGDSGQRFSLASPAQLPDLPDSPNRLGIFLLGLFLAGVLGVTVVAFAEFMDNAIYDVRTVTAIFGAPPLAVIPRI